ncbi:MAG: trypsin-like peptidase domain-containing protein [Candidatus Competibacteraceae bacterium]|nr:trypsin-like peptidase domain-containing protein [Candidatus Competibacteraceae bacterium]
MDDGAGGYFLSTSAYLRSGKPACEGEPFGDQPVAANCSAFLVGDDIVATAGHCINEGTMSSWRFVFGFAMLDAETPAVNLTAEQVYTPVEIIGHALESNGADYAIVRLDRAVTAPGAAPLAIRRNGLVDVGTPLGVIGHPAGLPLKLAFGPTTAVRDNSAETHFTANLDTFGGNSGSPVFDAASGLVEGILVRGEADYVIGTECFTSNYIADDAGRGEDVTKCTVFADLVPPLLSNAGSVNFDRGTYACDAAALITVRDSDLSGQPRSPFRYSGTPPRPWPWSYPQHKPVMERLRPRCRWRAME